MPSINDFIVEIETDSAHKTAASASSSSERRRIPKVPQELLSTKNSRQYFEPAAVSIGPYHHGNKKYESAEIIKRKVVRQFFVEVKVRVRVRDIYDKIHAQIKEVRDYYEKHPTDGFDDEKLTFMMLLDGAFLILCVLVHEVFFPVVTLTEHTTFCGDLVLLENQIPRIVIEVLLDSIGGPDFRSFFLSWYRMFFYFPDEERKGEMGTAVDHLLHKLLMTTRGDGRAEVADPPGVARCYNVRDIIANGILLKPGKPGKFDRISSSSGCIYGELIVPPLFMDEFTLRHLSNLIAYEMSQGYQFVVTSYICFLDSLIDGVEDIRELKSAGIVSFSQYSPHHEEELFIFIKQIATHGRTYCNNYFHVIDMINRHLGTTWKIIIRNWLTEVSMEYCRSPWKGIAVVAGFVMFFLTATQTYFAVFPHK